MSTTPQYNSGYLEHLHELAKESAQRVQNIPPFGMIIGIALFVHIAIIAPVYVMDLSEEVIEVTQVRVAFGVDQSRTEPKKVVGIKAPKPAISPQHVMRDIDTMLASSDNSASKQVQKQAVPRNPRANVQPQKRDVPKQPVRASEVSNKTKPSSARRSDGPVRPRRASVSAPSRAGAVSGGSSASQIRDVVQKYEQLLSSWVYQHRIYPDAAYSKGIEGDVTLRLRINRRGYVIYKAIEVSSGNATLDKAALDTVTRAAPMPVVPAEYPGDNQLEFLIPMLFRI